VSAKTLRRWRGVVVIAFLEAFGPWLPQRAVRYAGWQAVHGGVGFRAVSSLGGTVRVYRMKR
jgi:uncharacterized membrane protein YjgN (DUF898 family)